MSELTYKKIIDVETVETLNNEATVFVNDNGAMKQVGADKFGTVKTVNGVAPDENGDVFTKDLADICIVDMTDVIPGRISMNYKNKSYAEILDMLSRNGNDVRGAIVTRICLLKTGSQPVYTATAYDSFALHKMRICFGDNICPLIIDAEANAITLDPDWVAPEANITESAANTLVDTKVAELEAAVDTKLAELAAQELSLPKSAGVVDHGTAGQFAVSDGKGGIVWKTLVEAEEVSY